MRRYPMYKGRIKCCACRRVRKSNEPLFHWCQSPVGGDGYTWECPDCVSKKQNTEAAAYERKER